MSADNTRGRRKGATSKKVKDRQEVSKLFRLFLAQDKKHQKSSKMSKYFSTVSARHRFSGPFWGALIWEKCESLKSEGSGRKAPLQCSFFNIAIQFFVCCSATSGENGIRIAEKRISQCTFCSATFENCSSTSVFACGMLQGWGLGISDSTNHSLNAKAEKRETKKA